MHIWTVLNLASRTCPSRGFHSLIPPAAAATLKPLELALLLNGRADIEDLSVHNSTQALLADSVIAPISGKPNGPPDKDRTILNIGDSVSARTALEAVFEGHETALFLES